MPDDVPDEDLDRILAEEPEASKWLGRNRYRERFSLSAAEMDAEPWDEIAINQEIWRLDERKRKIDNKRMEQEQEQRRPNG